MKTTTTTFDLKSWRLRMRWTQAEASKEVGMSLSAYAKAEYRCQDRRGSPCNATLAKLCRMLEEGRVAA